MSTITSEDVECSRCHRMLKFTVFESLNVSLDPEYKEKVLDLSAFRMRCPDCGHITTLQYGFLYHDMKQHYMIHVCWNSHDLFQSDDPYLKHFAAGLKADPPYRFRNVLDYQQLVEKIHIFDAGLNDYAVEILKAAYRDQMEIPADQKFVFRRGQADELVFVTTGPDGTEQEIVTNLYPETLRQIAPSLPPENQHRFISELIFRQLAK